MGKEKVKTMKSSKKHKGFIIDELVDDIVSSVTSPPFSTTKWTCTTMSVDQRKDPSIKTCLVHIQRTWLGRCNLFVIKVHNCRKPFCEHIICNPDCETRTKKGSTKKNLKNSKRESRMVKEARDSYIKPTSDKKDNRLKTRKDKCRVQNNTRIINDFNEDVEASSLDQPEGVKKPSCTLQIFSEGKARKLNFLLHPAMEVFLGKALDKIQSQNVTDTADRKKLPTTEGKYDRTVTAQNIKQKRSNKKNASKLFDGQTPVRVTDSMEEFEIEVTDEMNDGSGLNHEPKLKMPHERKIRKKKLSVTADASTDTRRQQNANVECDKRQNNFENSNSYQKRQNVGCQSPKRENSCHPSKTPNGILFNQINSYDRKKNNQKQEDKTMFKNLNPKPFLKNDRKENYSEQMTSTITYPDQVSQSRSTKSTEKTNSFLNDDDNVFNNLRKTSCNEIMDDQAEATAPVKSAGCSTQKGLIHVYHTNENRSRPGVKNSARVSHDGPKRCTFVRDGEKDYADFNFEAHKEPVRDVEHNKVAGLTEKETKGHSRLTNDEHEGTWYDAYDQLEAQNKDETVFEDAVDPHDYREHRSASSNNEVIIPDNRRKNSLFKKRTNHDIGHSHKDAEGHKKSLEERPKSTYRKYSIIKEINDKIPSEPKLFRFLSKKQKSISRRRSNDIEHQQKLSKISQLELDDDILVQEQTMENKKVFVSCTCNRDDFISCVCDKDQKARGQNCATKPLPVMTEHKTNGSHHSQKPVQIHDYNPNHDNLSDVVSHCHHKIRTHQHPPVNGGVSDCLHHTPKHSIHNYQSSNNDIFISEDEACDNEIHECEEETNDSQHSFKLKEIHDSAITSRSSPQSYCDTTPQATPNSEACDFSHQSPIDRRGLVQHHQRGFNDICLDDASHTDKIPHEHDNNKTTGNKFRKLCTAKLNVKTCTNQPLYDLSQKMKTGKDSEEEYFYEKHKVIRKCKYKNTGNFPSESHCNNPKKNIRKVISDVSSLSKKDMINQRKTPKGKHTVINKTISIESIEVTDYIVADKDNNHFTNDDKSTESATLYNVDQNEVCENINKEESGCRSNDERCTQSSSEILKEDNSQIIALEYCCICPQNKFNMLQDSECYDHGEWCIGNNTNKYNGDQLSKMNEIQKKVRNFTYNGRNSEIRNKRKTNSDHYCEIHSQVPEKDKMAINTHALSVQQCNQHISNYSNHQNNNGHNFCKKCDIQEAKKGISSACAEINCLHCLNNSDCNSRQRIERKTSHSLHSENEKNSIFNHAGSGNQHCNKVKNMVQRAPEQNNNRFHANKMENHSNNSKKYFKRSTVENCINFSTHKKCSCTNTRHQESDIALRNPEIYIVYPGPVSLKEVENNQEKLENNSPPAQGYVVAYTVEPSTNHISDCATHEFQTGEQFKTNQINMDHFPPERVFLDKDEFKILTSDSDCENNLTYNYNHVNFDSDNPSEIDKSKNWVTENRRNKPTLCRVPAKQKSNSLLSLLSNFQNRKPTSTFLKGNKADNKNEFINHQPTLSATIAINPIQPMTNAYDSNDLSSENVNLLERNNYKLHTSCLSNTIKNNYNKIKVMMKRNSSKQLSDSVVSSESKFENVQYIDNLSQNGVSSSSMNVLKQNEIHCNHIAKGKTGGSEKSKTIKPSSSSSRSESILRRFQPLWYKAFSGKRAKVRPKSIEADLTGNMEIERTIVGSLLAGTSPEAVGENMDLKTHYVTSGSGVSVCEVCSKARDSTNQCSESVFIRNQRETACYQIKPEYFNHSDEHPLPKLQGNWFQDPRLDPITGFHPVLPN